MADRLTTERLAEIRAELANQLPADNLDKLVLLTRMIRAAYELLAEVDALTRERDEARSGFDSHCGWCRHKIGDDATEGLAEKVAEHLLSCPKNPLAAVTQERDQFAAALDRLRKSAKEVLGFINPYGLEYRGPNSKWSRWSQFRTNIENELDPAAILSARDARMKRLGAAEELERLAASEEAVRQNMARGWRERAAELRKEG